MFKPPRGDAGFEPIEQRVHYCYAVEMCIL